jgi:hypothetical protein
VLSWAPSDPTVPTYAIAITFAQVFAPLAGLWLAWALPAHVVAGWRGRRARRRIRRGLCAMCAYEMARGAPS